MHSLWINIMNNSYSIREGGSLAEKSRYESKEYKQELKHKAKLKRIEERGERKLRKRELKAKRDSYKEPKKKIQMTKIITWYLFVLLNAVLIYSMTVMYMFRDLSYLGVLITDIAAQVITFMIYACKSYKESKEEASINLERERLSYSDYEVNNDNSVG